MGGWRITIVGCMALAVGCDGRSLGAIERSVAATEADRRETKLAQDLQAAQEAVETGEGDADPAFQPIQWTTGRGAAAPWRSSSLRKYLDHGYPDPSRYGPQSQERAVNRVQAETLLRAQVRALLDSPTFGPRVRGGFPAEVSRPLKHGEYLLFYVDLRVPPGKPDGTPGIFVDVLDPLGDADED